MPENQTANNQSRLANAFLPIMHVFHHLAGEVVKLTDFSLAQYRVVMLVYRHGPISVKELKENLNIAQSSASEMIERLVQQGSLIRQKNPADRRMTQVKLTSITRKTLDKHIASMENIYREILNPLSNEEQHQLVLSFETILTLLQKNYPQTPDTTSQH